MSKKIIRMLYGTLHCYIFLVSTVAYILSTYHIKVKHVIFVFIRKKRHTELLQRGNWQIKFHRYCFKMFSVWILLFLMPKYCIVHVLHKSIFWSIFINANKYFNVTHVYSYLINDIYKQIMIFVLFLIAYWYSIRK